jgi:hypothetical protein
VLRVDEEILQGAGMVDSGKVSGAEGVPLAWVEGIRSVELKAVLMLGAGLIILLLSLSGVDFDPFLGTEALRVGNPGGNLKLPLLAQYLGGGKGTAGGELMLGFVSAVAVATILARGRKGSHLQKESR